MLVTIVPEKHLMTVWPLAAPLIEKAVEIVAPRITMLDILVRLTTGEYQLWIAANDEDELVAACTTEIIDNPRDRALIVRMLGGEPHHIDEWLKDSMRAVEEYARLNSCQYMEVQGRHGWEKKLKDHSFKRSWSVFERKL